MNYTFYANKYDIYARCYKNQSIPCVWTNPIVEYFNRPTVKQSLNVLPELWEKKWVGCNFEFSY